jgi:uncharacterized coiled-coil protein SlyX
MRLVNDLDPVDADASNLRKVSLAARRTGRVAWREKCDTKGEKAMVTPSESEVIAQQLNALGGRITTLETRLADVDTVIARLEGAALTTARSMQEISHHWDAVYEAMRRAEYTESG